MKIFKKKRNVTLEDIYEILQSVLTKMEDKTNEREERLEKMLFKAEGRRIAEYERVIDFKNQQLESKDKVIEQQAKTIEKLERGKDNGRKRKDK